MKNLSLIGLIAGTLLVGCQTKAPIAQDERISTALSKEAQQKLTPALAIQKLKEGNDRFLAGKQRKRDFTAQRVAAAASQYPFAILVSCMDSRTPSEVIFDQGLGDVFNIRIAGNVVNEDVLGSLEYGCLVAGARVILVMGHTKCGAVKSACEGVEMGNITGLLKHFEPAVQKVMGSKPRKKPTAEQVEAAEEEHVRQMVQLIQRKSPLLKEALDAGRVGIYGGIYELHSGDVRFFGLED